MGRCEAKPFAKRKKHSSLNKKHASHRGKKRVEGGEQQKREGKTGECCFEKRSSTTHISSSPVMHRAESPEREKKKISKGREPKNRRVQPFHHKSQRKTD